MFWLTLRNIRGRKLRYALTTLAVVLGVAFMATSFVLTDKLRSSFDELSVDIIGDVDFNVRASIQDGERFNRLPVPAELLEVITDDIPGVEAVSGQIMAWNVIPIVTDDDGKPKATKTRGAPQFGMNYFTDSGPLQEFFVYEGRPPDWTGDITDSAVVGEFIVDTKTAEDFDFEIGEIYKVSGPIGNRLFTLTGIANWRSPTENKNFGATLAAFEERTSHTFLDYEGTYDWIGVAVTPGADHGKVAASIQNRLDSYTQDFLAAMSTLPEEQKAALGFLGAIQLEVVDKDTLIEEQRDDFNSFLSVLSGVLLAFAIIAVIVSAFIINNTFSIVLGQRVRELALLRALGATTRQVFRSVILEAVIIGITATAVGLGVGYLLALGLRELLESVGFGALPGALPMKPRTIIVAASVSIGATVLSSILPARRTRSISPVSAMREEISFTPTSLRRRLLIGGTVTLIGIAELISGMILEINTKGTLWLLGTGAISTFAGIYMLSPIATKPVANLFGRPIQLLFKIPGQLARENAARRPRRTAATAAALTIGLALVSLAAVVSSSLKATVIDLIEDSTSMDLVIQVDGFGGDFQGFSNDLGNDLRTLSTERPDLVESVVSYRFTFDALGVDGDLKDVGSANFSLVDSHMDFDTIQGSTTTPAAPDAVGTILVHEDPATERGLKIGDPVYVTFQGSEEIALTTAAIFRNEAMLGNWVIDIETFDRYLPRSQDSFLSVLFNPDADPELARASVEAYTQEYPQLSVENRAEYREGIEKQLDQVLSVITTFLALSLLIAVLGITNTLALSVYEQTRELGLLRAVGMTRRQMRRMVRWEAVIIALFGGLLGVSMGVFFGVAATAAIPADFVSILSIPFGSLTRYLIISGLFGVLASILPAFRASRLNVLDAISHN